MLEPEDAAVTGVVTVIACLQMSRFAENVASARKMYRIFPPAVDGHPTFERVFRAHQNCVESFGIFMSMLWTASMFCNQYAASMAGMLYIIGRQTYVEGYCRNAKDRVTGYRMSVLALMVLLLLTTCGLAQTLLYQFIGFNLKEAVTIVLGR